MKARSMVVKTQLTALMNAFILTYKWKEHGQGRTSVFMLSKFELNLRRETEYVLTCVVTTFGQLVETKQFSSTQSVNRLCSIDESMSSLRGTCGNYDTHYLSKTNRRALQLDLL